MGIIRLQMIDSRVSSFWWKELIKYFIQVDDLLEIRCWKEETAEIRQAALYGTPTEDRNEISVKGVVSDEFLAELMVENPSDKSIYNKMTKYFTINTEHEDRRICSAHYGTELYIMGVSHEEIAFFCSVMAPYSDGFSISIQK